MTRLNAQVIGFWAIALCFLAALVACHPPQSSDRTVLRRGQAGEPSTLDPGLAADIYSTTLVTDLYEGLTSESPSGEVVPGVAKSWTVDPAGTEYTFTLRSDARWSNGEAVTAGGARSWDTRRQGIAYRTRYISSFRYGLGGETR
jgi:oligopeptide transport system substrate-binding protein